MGSLYAEIENESDPGTWTVIYTFFENDQTDRLSFVSTGEQDVSSYFGDANYRLRFRSYTEESNNGHYHIWIDNCTLSIDGPPAITVESPENITYPASVWFNVTLNKVGSWCGYSLDGAVNVTMDGSGTEWYKENSTMSEGEYNVTFSCNDTSGKMNASTVIEYFSVDTTYPQYSFNQTNSTEAGSDAMFSLYWTDSNLAGYIFSFDNGTGTFTNDSYVGMTGTGNWSNVSKWVNSTAGSTIRWQVYTNDSAGNMNASLIYSFDATDVTPPIIIIQSPLNQTYNTESFWFNVTLNEVGSWCGYSLDRVANVSMDGSGTIWHKENQTMTEGAHNVTFSCNDTAGNMNQTDTIYFNVIDISDAFKFKIITTGTPQTFSFQTDNAVNLFVDWGDGNSDTYSGTGLRSHEYATAGDYNISLVGEASRISFYEGTEDLLKDILTPMSNSVTGITSAYQMFRGATGITTFTAEDF
ncbi:MAG: hypothetical protein GQ477_03955, partial [Nanohaloarchaea archaeon]|nr:hypothetical protein [Candidatus Nanohaloarchaea archaeon]